MNSYKITNITNLVGRRDSKFNTIIDIEYIDNRIKKTIKLKAGETVFLTVNSLPLSIHRLRIKGLININEVSVTELAKTMEKERPKTIKKLKKTKKTVVVVEKKDNVVDNTQKKTKTTTKTTTKKKNIDKE